MPRRSKELGSGTGVRATNLVTKPSLLATPVGSFTPEEVIEKTREMGSVDDSASNTVVEPPLKLRTSKRRLPKVGSYRKGVENVIRMSNAFGPFGGPVNELESESAPLNTVVTFDPTLFANVVLKPSTGALVVEREICTFGKVDEKAPPKVASGRKATAEIRIGAENSVEE